MPSADGMFFGLRQRARKTLVGEHSALVILRKLQDRPKYMSLPALSSVFGVAGLVWSEEETDYIVGRFADNRRRIDWRRLIRALDVAPPEDFTDPDRTFVDQLPQPYRRIVSVLDTEIVDRAWAKIVSEHPELDPSPADEARAAAEIDLKRSCPPALWIHPSENVPKALQVDTHRRADPEVADRGHNFTDDFGVESSGPRDASSRGVTETSSTEKSDASATAEKASLSDVLTTVEWDQCGEFLFTGSGDGFVSLRRDDALVDIVGVVEIFPGGVNPGVTRLSHPVGALTDRLGRPSSIRIAVAATERLPPPRSPVVDTKADGSGMAGEQEGRADRAGLGEEGDTENNAPPVAASLPRSRVCVLEVAESSSGENTVDNGQIRSQDFPTFRIISFADFSRGEGADEASSLSLSPDGRRLAVAVSKGSLVTWSLPPFSPPAVISSSHRRSLVATETSENKERICEGEGGNEGIHSAERTYNGMACQQISEERENSRNFAGRSTDIGASTVLQLRRPDFFIPHLPSPEERAYEKAMIEYRRRIDAGETEEDPEPDEIGSGPGDDTKSSLKPKPPPKNTTPAYHLAHATFLSDVVSGGNGTATDVDAIGGAGLAVWRSRSNVWRLYRLPSSGGKGAAGGREAETSSETGGKDVDPSTAADENTPGEMGPISDSISLQSAEWILPSPVTVSAVCDAGVGIGSFIDDFRKRAASPAFPPLVAVGTDNGGVYVCDGASATTRKGLSRHRARVTALAFHGRRFLVSGSEDEMIHIHDIAASSTSQRTYADGGNNRRHGEEAGIVRCLHDARGSGIRHVACLDKTPLTFAEDTSGRIVVYDLLTGTMLGVLGLGAKGHGQSQQTAPKSNTTPEMANNYQNSAGTQRYISASGRDCVAVAVPVSPTKVGEQVGAKDAPCARDSTWKLGVWPAGDLIWGLCPGVRAMAYHERPTDSAFLAELFYELSPIERKSRPAVRAAETTTTRHVGTDSNAHTPSRPQVALQPDTRGGRHSTKSNTAVLSRPQKSTRARAGKSASAPIQSAIDKFITAPFHGTPSRANESDSRMPDCRTNCASVANCNAGEKGGATDSLRTAKRVDSSFVYQAPASLTEGNISQMLGGKTTRSPAPWMRVDGAPGICGGLGVESEIGEAERVRRYMERRHGERAAREARLASVTKHLLQTL